MRPRQRNFFTMPLCFLFCFIFAAGLFVVVQYLDACSAWAEKNIASLNKEASRLTDQIQQFDSLMTGYRDDIKRFESLLFNERDIAAFLEGISGSSQKYKIKVKEISAMQPETVKIKDPLSAKDSKRVTRSNANNKEEEGVYLMSSPYKIRVSGETKGVFDFMSDLEKNKQLLTLSDFHITGKMYPELQVEFRLDLYSLSGLMNEQRIK